MEEKQIFKQPGIYTDGFTQNVTSSSNMETFSVRQTKALKIIIFLLIILHKQKIWVCAFLTPNTDAMMPLIQCSPCSFMNNAILNNVTMISEFFRVLTSHGTCDNSTLNCK